MSILDALRELLKAVRSWLMKPVADNTALLLRIKNELKRLEDKMSELGDKLDVAISNFGTLKDQVTGLGTDLLAEIQQIKDAIAAGNAPSAEDFAKLESLSQGVVDLGGSIQGLRDQVKGIIPD